MILHVASLLSKSFFNMNINCVILFGESEISATRWQSQTSASHKRLLTLSFSLPHFLFLSGDNLSSGRQWVTLDVGVCGGVLGGWTPATVPLFIASSSFNPVRSQSTSSFNCINTSGCLSRKVHGLCHLKQLSLV